MTREEAIRRIKSWNLNSDDMEVLSVVIPELSERNEEEIRERLVEYFKGFYDKYYSWNDGNIRWEGLEVKKVIAYLEKQKAKERLDRMAPIYNDKESFESALEKAWKYYNESASRTVDSFEDDYIECVFSKGFREGFLYKEKKKEQKLDDVKREWWNKGYFKGRKYAHIPARELGLPSSWDFQQEWSNEEIGHLHTLASYIKSKGYEDDGEFLEGIVNKLKSLRPPQYCENCKLKRSVENWKPSKEQIRSLEYFVKLWGNTDEQIEYVKIFNDVKSLLGDLKKL